MMAEPSTSKPTVQQQQQIVANELSSSKTSTLPVRDRLNTPAPTQHPRADATCNSDGRNVRGPRCITIQRSSAGFGFTLRHFIVYPPDSVSDCPEEWQRGMSAGLLDPMIPMDTIFVKHVRENGPAVKAGLSTGDQVVSVNGESVMCKSYAQVVQMIQKSGPNLQLVVMPKEHDVLQQCFADTAHNPYTNARPVIPAAGSAEDQTGKMTMDPLMKPNNIMSHLPRPKPYQPFQVETKKPVTPQQQAGAHVQKATQQQPLGRVLSPLVTAGTTTTAASSRPTAAATASDDAAVAAQAQARLAAAAALVSKSVRKSADFNPNGGGAAGSRGSLVVGGVGGGGDYYPGATTGFSSSSVSAVSAVHSKRSSYAGTPTCKTEFIYSINAPASAFTSSPAAAGSVGGHARYADPSSLPHQPHHHHQHQQQQQQPQQHHQFHYPVHPMEMAAAIHGSVSSLQQQQQLNLRDSPLNSSKGSLYSAASECNEQQSHQQAQVMTRIKKSFEQKEEFLKRPALPYWVNVQEAQQSPPVPKEFYAQPQKFARPVWPPISASLTASLDSLSSADVTTTPTQQQPPQQLQQQQQQQHHKSTAVTKTEVIHTGITSMEPWSVSFTSKRATPPASPSQSPGAVGLGLVPNTVPKPFYGSTNTTTTTTTTTTVTASSSSNSTGSPSGNKQFVSTLSRIQENIAAEPPPEPKPSRQLTLMHAPLASPEEFFTPSPTKAGQHPLAASSVATATAAASAAAAPVVVKRSKPFENGAEKGLLARIAQRGKQQQEAAAVAAAAVAAAAAASAAAAERYSKSTSEFQRVPAGGSGNRTVIIGSSNLHCQPPAMEMEFPPNTYDAQVTWNEEEERQSLVLRQHSYRSAVRDFAASASSPSPLQLTTDLSLDENSNTSASSSIVAVSRVKKRPSHLQLTGNDQLSQQQQQQQQQQQSWLVQQPPAKGPCLQTDIDADDNVSATTTTTTTSTTSTTSSSSNNNNNINCLVATVDRTGSSGSPLSLPRPSPIASDFELSVLERFDQLLASLGTSSGSSSLGSSGSLTVHQQQQESQQSLTKMTTTPAATASVNRRQKIYDDDSDRGMRRISYLKAQAGNPVDGPSLLVSATTTEAETVVTATTNTATTTTTPINNEHTAKGSTSWAVVKVETNLTMMVSAMDRVQPPVGMISRLRQYFEDKSRPPPPPPSHPRIAAATTTTTNATPTPLSSTSTLASKTAAASAHPPPLAPSRRSAHQPHSIQKLRSLFGDTKVSLTSKSQQQGGGGDSGGAHPPSPSEAEGREGWLYVKQTIIDCRRSTDRSWRQMWTRIRSGTVHFTRDRNTAMASNGNNSYSNSYNSNSGSTPGAGADDMMIDLRGCTVEVAVYYTKRKNVLRLSTFNGLCEYLMQCEDSSDMVLWLDSFQQEQAAANSSDKEDGPGSSYSSSEMMLVRQAHEADNNSMAHGRRMGRFTLHRNRSPTGHSPVSKTRKPSLPGTIGGGGGGGGGGGSNSADGPNSTPANANKPTTWRRKVVQQFKKIQGNSPNSQANAMIPEGATIGVPLEFCPRSSLSESIPLIVELCVGIVEARGLESVGVYRVPGNSVAVNALSDSLNRGFDGLNQSDPRWNDVNVISSLMKSFFRKLPDPLVTSELYGALIEASKTEPEQVRFNSIKRLVDELPEPHYSTLRYLVGHLSRVAGKSHVNKMEARNLAIVFGPTLIRPGDDSTVTMVTDMSHQCRIVETLIDKVDFFFPPDQDQVVDPPVQQQQQQQQQQPNSPTTLASNSNLSSSADERKDSYAKEIVLSIITAARKKRQTSLDSPDLSERGDAAPVFPVMPVPVPVVVTTTASATMTTATISTTLIMATTQFSSSAAVPTGSAHSLVELGSTGGQPALPVEASEFRLSTAEVPATPPTVERKRSASLGGETVMPPPSPILAMADLAGITEMVTDGLAQASGSSEPFRSRTSSGSFVVNKLHPIDAAGIRSYSGLSAVTQERIRLFEQETKAMLQRDLARQVRREGEPMPPASAGGIRRLDKTEVESAWHRAKLEMETDDFLDVLADNLSEVADSTADASHQDKDNQPEQQQQQQPQQPEQPKTRVDPLPVAVVMENGGADEKLVPRPINEKEPEAVQVLPAVQKENVPVTEEKLDEKPAVELQVGNAVVVKSSAGRIVAANRTTATTTTTVKQQTTIVAGVAGAVGRSQIPKPSATANKSANDSTPTGKVAAVDSARISPTKSTMSISSSSSSSAVRNRSSMAVVGRAKTVELGKSAAPPAGKKMSVGELQAPKVIRQMSAGQMQPQSPSRILPVKGNARLKSAETSPTKKASIASLNKTEETKKAATTTDGEQSKRLLESNLDEAVNISDQPRGGLKEAELADRANSKQPSVRRESKSAEAVGKGVKRSDSLTKDEKTESNTKAREREMRQTGGQKSAKKFVQRSGESGLKRRHTVGGTRDFDKVRIRWLADKSDERNVIPAPRWSAWDRLQPLISDEDLNVDRSLRTWMRSERIRTSSPELCRRSEMACATIINNSLSPPPPTDSQPLEAPSSSAIRADGDVSSP